MAARVTVISPARKAARVQKRLLSRGRPGQLPMSMREAPTPGEHVGVRGFGVFEGFPIADLRKRSTQRSWSGRCSEE